jgi:hypothetical protein
MHIMIAYLITFALTVKVYHHLLEVDTLVEVMLLTYYN